jgi:hypothetical protein
MAFPCLIASLLILAALLSVPAAAASREMLGSLTITGPDGAALTTQLTGVAVIANPGFEKNITVQIPPFTFPVFVQGETTEESASRLLKKNFDTTLILTNTTAAPLVIELVLRDSSGSVLSSTVETLAAHASKVIFVSTLLP